MTKIYEKKSWNETRKRTVAQLSKSHPSWRATDQGSEEGWGMGTQHTQHQLPGEALTFLGSSPWEMLSAVKRADTR